MGPLGPMGDPQQFAEALRRFADLMAYQGGAINWDLAKNIARQTVSSKGDPSVLDTQRKQVADALRLADLWLEDATDAADRDQDDPGVEPGGVGRGDAAGVVQALRSHRRARGGVDERPAGRRA